MMLSQIFWFTGLSGVGKTTIANLVKNHFKQKKRLVLVLDGDDIRSKLHKHLGFSPPEIKKNNQLIASLCQKYRHGNDIILVPIISPYRKSRSLARIMLQPGYYEIHFDADIETLHIRDTKGLYKMAQQGEINNLIGVSKKNVYEPPTKPDLYLNTSSQTTADTLGEFINFIDSKMVLSDIKL